MKMNTMKYHSSDGQGLLEFEETHSYTLLNGLESLIQTFKAQYGIMTCFFIHYFFEQDILP
jgi:hypothetical protein